MPLPGVNWKWETDWQVLNHDRHKIKQINPEELDKHALHEDHDGTFDHEGWQYAPEFGARFSGTAKLTDFVRRRKWVRTCMKTD